MQSNSVTNGQKFTVSANPVDANGQATAGSSTPLVWTSSDVTVATVAGLGGNNGQAMVQSVGEGNCNITTAGTGPSGPISTSFSLAVAGGPLAGFVFVFGAAQ